MPGRIKYFQVRILTNTLIPASSLGLSSVRLACRILTILSQTYNTLKEVLLSSQRAEDEVAELNTKAIAMDAVYELEMEKLEAEMLKQDHTGWWSRTIWQQYFGSHNLKWLAYTSRLPDRDKPFLLEIIEIFDTLFAQAVTGIQTLDQEMRRWLRSEKRYEILQRPFARLQNTDSEDCYKVYMCWFVCYTMRVWFYSEIEAIKNIQQDTLTNIISLYVSINVSNTVSTSVLTTTNTTVLLYLDNDETTNNDNIPNTIIDFNFDNTPNSDSDTDSNDEDDSNDDSDNEEESIIIGITTPLAPESYQDIDKTKDARELFLWTLAQRHCIKILYNMICDDY